MSDEAKKTTVEHDEFNVKFFRHLDTPMMIFIFESDEFMLGLAVYMSSLIVAASAGIQLEGGVIVYACISLIVMISYMKYKKNKPEGYMMAKLYRFGILEPRSLPQIKKLTKKEGFS